MPKKYAAKQNKKSFLTPEGLYKIKKELEELISVKRPRVQQRIQRAREFGDISENSEYDAALEEQAFIEGRISDLEEGVRGAQLIDTKQKAADFVVIGSTVKVQINDEIHSFTIVGSMEADPASNKISNESPVGKSLLGARLGETIDISVGPVKSTVKVLEFR
ncbi:MAG TPA: transcription elongation factor GreA [Patescibacteria group bacterium]